MKKLLTPILFAALLTGCAHTKPQNPSVGPAVLRLGVGTGAGYALMKYPQAEPGVRAGADIACAAASGTNFSPAEIVAALDAYHVNSPEAILILNAAMSLYSITVASVPQTNAAAAKPYAEALCGGLVDALTLYGNPMDSVPLEVTPSSREAAKPRRLPPVPNKQFPQAKLP